MPVVVWPKEGARYPTLSRSFTFGSIPAGARLEIEGATVAARPSGAFLAMVSLGTGTVRLSYSIDGATICARQVEVEAPFGASPAEEGALRALEPSTTTHLRAGEVLIARALGPPGLAGTFSIRGLTRELPLAPREGRLYEGHYRVQPEDEGRDLPVRFTFPGKGWSKLKAEAPGRVTVLDPSSYRVAVTSAPVTVVKSGVGGYTFFLPPGVPLAVVGRSGGMHHVELSATEDGWVGVDRVRLLPEGTAPPAAAIGRNVSTAVSSASVRLFLSAPARLPFEVRQTVEPLAFEVRFYGGQQWTDRIHYPSEDPVVREVSWRQEDPRTAVFTVRTRLEWGWGYDAYYEGGRFVLEMRRPPLLPRNKGVLAGRRLALDPGHGPEVSAVGPLGSTERDVVLAIAERLKAMLEKEGASVYMVRTSSMGPPLAERPALAWQNRADLYVSVHANGLPVTADPFEIPRGYMTFYHQPQSRALAEAVQASYRRAFPELADESLRWGDLAVCRLTQMPSILTESAYMMLPEQEELLIAPKHQERFAKAMLEGVRAYYETYRKLQLASPAELRAATP